MENDNVIAFHSRAELEREKASRTRVDREAMHAESMQRTEFYGPPLQIDLKPFIERFSQVTQAASPEMRREQLAILDELSEEFEQVASGQIVIIQAVTMLTTPAGVKSLELIEVRGLVGRAEAANARSNWHEKGDATKEQHMLGFVDIILPVYDAVSDGQGGLESDYFEEPAQVPIASIETMNFESKPGPRLSAV